MTENRQPLKCYLCCNKHIEERLKSTSGGLFYTIGKFYIDNFNAIVYGARFDKDFNVVHDGADNIEQLNRLRGSKYSQSDIRSVYREIRGLLENGQYVVFSGTPCQVSAIKKYLAKDYERLLCIDIICYGVASPGVWYSYLREYHCINRIKRIDFKDKAGGWKNWKTMIEHNNRKFYMKGLTNPFMSGYMNGTYMRPSCLKCKFKGNNRMSDITMGDAWGRGEQSQLNDDSGLSIAIIQSQKGGLLIEQIKDKLLIEEVNFAEYIEGNPYYSMSPKLNSAKREKYIEEYINNGFRSAFEKYCMPHGIRRLKYHVEYWMNSCQRRRNNAAIKNEECYEERI